MKLIIFILIVLIIAALLIRIILRSVNQHSPLLGNDSNLLIVFYVQIMPDDLVMQLHRF